MKSLLSAYLWCYDKPEAADVSFRKFREFYKDGEIYCNVDLGGKIEEFKEVCDKWGAIMTVNPINVGRCGWMAHYENYEQTGPELDRKCWPKENAFVWMDRLYQVAKECNSKYLISLEDDTYILKPISILNEEFGISVFEYNTNILPDSLLDVVNQLDGNVDIPLNKFGNKAYGAGGGFIINCEQFVESWNKFRPILELNYDMIKDEYSHLIGWVDVLPQLTIMIGGYRVIQNPQMVQTWYHERPDLYPTYTHWKNYEIADFVKDIEEIRKL